MLRKQEDSTVLTSESPRVMWVGVVVLFLKFTVISIFLSVELQVVLAVPSHQVVSLPPVGLLIPI